MTSIAHGSGLDELLLFLAAPALWGLYNGVRWLVRRVRGPLDSPP